MIKPGPKIQKLWDIREAEKVLCGVSMFYRPLVNLSVITGDNKKDNLEFYGEVGVLEQKKPLEWILRNYKLFPPGNIYELFGYRFVFLKSAGPEVIIPEELSREYFDILETPIKSYCFDTRNRFIHRKDRNN